MDLVRVGLEYHTAGRTVRVTGDRGLRLGDTTTDPDTRLQTFWFPDFATWEQHRTAIFNNRGKWDVNNPVPRFVLLADPEVVPVASDAPTVAVPTIGAPDAAHVSEPPADAPPPSKVDVPAEVSKPAPTALPADIADKVAALHSERNHRLNDMADRLSVDATLLRNWIESDASAYQVEAGGWIRERKPAA